jgi:hypothetical protein
LLIGDVSFTFGNTTPLIYVTDPYPADDSNFFGMQPTLAFTLGYAEGLINYSVFIGNSTSNCTRLLETVYDVGNGTYTFDNYYSATELGESYYWRVQAWNGSVFVNESFVFHALVGGGSIAQTPGFSVFVFILSLFCIVGLPKLFRFTEKNKYD